MPNCVLSVGIIKSYSVYNFMIKKKIERKFKYFIDGITI